MPDLLLELLSEEIPARMQARARADLARLLKAELSKAGLQAESVQTYSTPRRLALIARNLPLGTPATAEELKGPRTSAPPQALEGFLRKTGLRPDQLTDRDGIWFARQEKPGRATADLLAEAIPAIVRAFPWPKSMRWGAASLSTESLRWVRPLQGVVAMLDEELIDFEIGDVRSGAATIGHRFHHPGRITLAADKDYVEKLKACHVIVDHEERARLIREGAAAAAAAEGLTLVEDEGLVEENAGLTEWPVPLLGRFDPAFLDVPREVIQLTMRTNQKYFAATKSSPAFAGEGDHPQDGGGAGEAGSSLGQSTTLTETLAPAFICVANIAASDGGARIVEGNQKVLAARLSDARFFWEQDLKVPLEQQAAKLSQIVFHEKLGTVADKVDRVAKLARWLVEEGTVKSSPGRGGGPSAQQMVEGAAGSAPRSLDTAAASPPLHHSPEASGPPPRAGEDREQLAALAERAARLCKADLVTQMVGEFPELQGLIGGYLAEAQGEDPQVAAAIRDHYKPAGQGDEVPTAPVTVAVSLADKLDTIGSFFDIGEKPTGSKDPFALRRAAIGALALVVENSIRFHLEKVFIRIAGEGEAVFDLFGFFIERLKVQQRSASVRHDLIEAVFMAEEETEVVRLLARVRALQSFVETPEGADLLAGYKRAANILRKEGWVEPVIPAEAGISLPSGESGQGSEIPASAGMTGFDAANPISLSYTPEPAETALIAALDSAEPEAAAAVEREDFEGAMRALATLRAPVDAFFNEVIVNDPDPAKREARLNLLARMRDAVHRVADFSRIEG